MGGDDLWFEQPGDYYEPPIWLSVVIAAVLVAAMGGVLIWRAFSVSDMTPDVADYLNEARKRPGFMERLTKRIKEDKPILDALERRNATTSSVIGDEITDLDARNSQQSIEFRGEFWRIVDARYDVSGLEGGVGSHWHLTLTGPLRGQDKLDAANAAKFRMRHA